MASRVDAIVAGAGVVGLACAAELARRGQEVVVLERNARAGEGISSRNSGVIHAGLYYPPASLKARLCVRGRDLLYRFCAERGVPHRRCGKWVVATSAQECAALRALHERAGINGAGPVHWLEGAALRSRAPGLAAVAALEVEPSGLVDVAALVLALEAELQRLGGVLLTHGEVVAVEPDAQGFRVRVAGQDAVRCTRFVNACGLGAQALAERTSGVPCARIPALHYAAGHYYRLRRGGVPFDRLVYPLPGPSGLGVHLGFDPAGRPRFGPDVRFLDHEDYRFDDSRREPFAEAIRRWWPALQAEDLVPDFVGIRPKLAGPGGGSPDFVIQDARDHGLPGLVQLFGIESPGLTSALAIAEEVARRLEV